MDKVIKPLLELLPFNQFFEYLGFSKDTSLALSAALTAFLVYLLVEAYKYLLNRWKNLKTARDLKPQFDYLTVKNARQYFIPTQGQDRSPSREDEIRGTHKHAKKVPLIPWFIKSAFDERVENQKFYLVLADSGMGKTTFMINLYVQYHSFFNFRKKHQMRLYRLGDKRTLDQIKGLKLEAKKNTILLLDALDEDPFILPQDEKTTNEEAFRKRVDEIVEAVQDFCEVVISCRTQYFPGQERDVYELKIKRPDGRGFHTFSKNYISPFTDAEVQQYLNKKFGRFRLWNRVKKQKAASIVKNSPNLVVRPMLLSYIDDLVEANTNFNSTYKIYETLIEKWLIREAEKRKKITERSAFINNLRQHAHQTALSIYRNLREHQLLYLSKESAITIAQQNNIELKPNEITGQSLLTCDAESNWKFAHKSILEFFLAKEYLENDAFRNELNFEGMDVAKEFVEEIIPSGFVYIKKGTFIMGSSLNELEREERERPHQVTLSYNLWMSKYLLTQKDYQAIVGKNPSSFKGHVRNPVEQVSWKDAVAFCNRLNEKAGYGPTVDSQGNLLDSSGKPTEDITEVKGYRLPTEAEWEYACRAGTSTPFHTGNNLTTDQANYDGNYPYAGAKKGKYREQTTLVGTFPANDWGLHDMHGNLWEWCFDWYGAYEGGEEENPIGPKKGTFRVLRGGSWNRSAHFCRSANRRDFEPGYRNSFIGFRLVFVP